MPRKPRIEYAGAVYHVMSRGVKGMPIRLAESDWELFVETLGQACERTGWQVHAAVQMVNHTHLLLETPEGNLVDGMKWFQGVAISLVISMLLRSPTIWSLETYRPMQTMTKWTKSRRQNKNMKRSGSWRRHWMAWSG